MSLPLQKDFVRQAQLFEHATCADVSRREFLRRTAAVAGGVAGLGLLRAAPAVAASSGPKPIPGGFGPGFKPVAKHPLIHVLAPALGSELSTIGDFNGVVAASEIQGSAKGSDGSTLSFDTDMRIMQGMYVGLDGRLRQGTFAFI